MAKQRIEELAAQLRRRWGGVAGGACPTSQRALEATIHPWIKLGAVVLTGLIAGWGFVQSLVTWLPPVVTGAAVIEANANQIKIPEKITLSEGKQPGPVILNHDTHGPLAERSGKGCAHCHHTMTNAQLKTNAPPKCSACHLRRGDAKNPKVKGKDMWVQEAFHATCTDCHKQAKKGPVKCLECKESLASSSVRRMMSRVSVLWVQATSP